MTTLSVSHERGRDAALASLGALFEVATGLADDDLLAASRCRGWTTGDVLVHVHVGLQDLLLAVLSPTDDQPDTDAAAYWRSQPPSGAPDADAVDQTRFVRAVGAAYRRPTGLVAHLRPAVEVATRVVAATPPSCVVFQGMTMTTGDVLATWAVEFAVHHLDLGRELDLPAPEPTSLALARATVEALAGGALPAKWPDEDVVLVGTGRVPATSAQRAASPFVGALPVLG